MYTTQNVVIIVSGYVPVGKLVHSSARTPKFKPEYNVYV